MKSIENQEFASNFSKRGYYAIFPLPLPCVIMSSFVNSWLIPSLLLVHMIADYTEILTNFCWYCWGWLFPYLSVFSLWLKLNSAGEEGSWVFVFTFVFVCILVPYILLTNVCRSTYVSCQLCVVLFPFHSSPVQPLAHHQTCASVLTAPSPLLSTNPCCSISHLPLPPFHLLNLLNPSNIPFLQDFLAPVLVLMFNCIVNRNSPTNSLKSNQQWPVHFSSCRYFDKQTQNCGSLLDLKEGCHKMFRWLQGDRRKDCLNIAGYTFEHLRDTCK